MTTYQQIKRVFEKDFEYYFIIGRKDKLGNLKSRICSGYTPKYFYPDGVYKINNEFETKSSDHVYNGLNSDDINYNNEVRKDNFQTEQTEDKIKYKFANHQVKSLNTSKLVPNNKYVTGNNTIQKTFNSKSRNISVDYKLPPGEIHFSENDIDNVNYDGETVAKDQNTNDNIRNIVGEDHLDSGKSEQDSLNQKIFSIINSSGTVDDNASDGKAIKYIIFIEILAEMTNRYSKPEEITYRVRKVETISDSESMSNALGQVNDPNDIIVTTEDNVLISDNSHRRLFEERRTRKNNNSSMIVKVNHPNIMVGNLESLSLEKPLTDRKIRELDKREREREIHNINANRKAPRIFIPPLKMGAVKSGPGKVNNDKIPIDEVPTQRKDEDMFEIKNEYKHIAILKHSSNK